MGLFGEVLAWCLATEEQGRKTLHGHFLIWVSGWNDIAEQLERYGPTDKDAVRQARAFHDNACSVRLFEEFEKPHGLLSERPVFQHECKRTSRQQKEQ